MLCLCLYCSVHINWKTCGQLTCQSPHFIQEILYILKIKLQIYPEFPSKNLITLHELLADEAFLLLTLGKMIPQILVTNNF